MIQWALFMNGLLRRDCRSFQAHVMPGEPPGRTVTVPILCFWPEAHGNVVSDVAIPHIPQGLVDLLPVPLIDQPALLPVVAHHFTALAHLPRRCLSPPGKAMMCRSHVLAYALSEQSDTVTNSCCDNTMPLFARRSARQE